MQFLLFFFSRLFLFFWWFFPAHLFFLLILFLNLFLFFFVFYFFAKSSFLCSPRDHKHMTYILLQYSIMTRLTCLAGSLGDPARSLEVKSFEIYTLGLPIPAWTPAFCGLGPSSGTHRHPQEPYPILQSVDRDAFQLSIQSLHSDAILGWIQDDSGIQSPKISCTWSTVSSSFT